MPAPLLLHALPWLLILWSPPTRPRCLETPRAHGHHGCTPHTSSPVSRSSPARRRAIFLLFPELDTCYNEQAVAIREHQILQLEERAPVESHRYHPLVRG